MPLASTLVAKFYQDRRRSAGAACLGWINVRQVR